MKRIEIPGRIDDLTERREMEKRETNLCPKGCPKYKTCEKRDIGKADYFADGAPHTDCSSGPNGDVRCLSCMGAGRVAIYPGKEEAWCEAERKWVCKNLPECQGADLAIHPYEGPEGYGFIQ